MATKEKPTNVNTNKIVNNNFVNVHVPPTKEHNTKREKKPHWIVKAIVLAAIGLVVSLILIFVKHSTAANGKPAFIQGGTPADNTK